MSSEHFVLQRLTNIDAAPMPATAPLHLRLPVSRVDREQAVERFVWHVAPLQALRHVDLHIAAVLVRPQRVYTQSRSTTVKKAGDELVIQHPDLAKYLADLQDTEKRAAGVKDDFVYSKKKRTTFGWPLHNYNKDDPVIIRPKPIARIGTRKSKKSNQKTPGFQELEGA